jgi:hypothetical protein
LEKSLEIQQKDFPNKPIGEIIVELGYATEEEIKNALEKQKTVIRTSKIRGIVNQDRGIRR